MSFILSLLWQFCADDVKRRTQHFFCFCHESWKWSVALWNFIASSSFHCSSMTNVFSSPTFSKGRIAHFLLPRVNAEQVIALLLKIPRVYPLLLSCKPVRRSLLFLLIGFICYSSNIIELTVTCFAVNGKGKPSPPKLSPAAFMCYI